MERPLRVNESSWDGIVSHKQARPLLLRVMRKPEGSPELECEIRPLDIPKNPSKEAALPLTHLCKSPVVTQATVGMFFVFHEVGSCIIRGVISFLEKSHFILLWAKLYSSCHLFPTFSSASSISCLSSLLDPSCISLPLLFLSQFPVTNTEYMTPLSWRVLVGKKKGGEKLAYLFWMSFIPKSLSKSVISSFLIGRPSKKGDAKIWNGQDIM